MKTIDLIRSIAEDNGWGVSEEEIAPNVISFEFSKFSPAGQDFSFYVEMKDADVFDFIKNMEYYYLSYDPDCEAMHWVDENGHGKYGAPHSLCAIVKDMIQTKSMVRNLLRAFNNNLPYNFSKLRNKKI